MIYFIEHPDNFVKIGFTDNNLLSRFSQLQIASPHKLKVVLVIEGSYDEEQQLHKRFQKFNVNGEWFHISQEIKEFIDSNYDKDLSWTMGFKESEFKHGTKVRELRVSEGLSLQEASEKVGISPQSFNEIESRELKGGVTMRVMHKVAQAFGKKFEYRFV